MLPLPSFFHGQTEARGRSRTGGALPEKVWLKKIESMEKISVGGQAVIEGVMMRAPNALAIAVRKPNGEVAVKEDVWRSLSHRLKFLKWPLIRGSVVLMETLINGFQALSFSADQALEKEDDQGKGEKKLSSWGLSLILAGAFGIGILFFVVLPHYLTGFGKFVRWDSWRGKFLLPSGRWVD